MVGFGTCGPQTLEPKSLIARFKGIWGLFRLSRSLEQETGTNHYFRDGGLVKSH